MHVIRQLDILTTRITWQVKWLFCRSTQNKHNTTLFTILFESVNMVEHDIKMILAVMFIGTVLGLWAASWLFLFESKEDTARIRQMMKNNEANRKYIEKLNNDKAS